MSDRRITPETPINQSGPLAVPLFDTPAGVWMLSSASGGACQITLEMSADASGGAVIWPDRCAALPFSASRWTLDAVALVLWSNGGERVASFRTDMLPPLSGEDASGGRLTLSRR
ncbi:MAG: AprI/Inh family metalloprotease inhibitor [Hyphomonadaceae bacterium]|nr:AprI/Inh family metalloprotease inhibitor [Hyphomonadaceae bacterium]